QLDAVNRVSEDDAVTTAGSRNRGPQRASAVVEPIHDSQSARYRARFKGFDPRQISEPGDPLTPAAATPQTPRLPIGQHPQTRRPEGKHHAAPLLENGRASPRYACSGAMRSRANDHYQADPQPIAASARPARNSSEPPRQNESLRSARRRRKSKSACLC